MALKLLRRQRSPAYSRRPSTHFGAVVVDVAVVVVIVVAVAVAVFVVVAVVVVMVVVTAWCRYCCRCC